MNTTIERYPAMDPNPVLNVSKDGTVLDSNEASEPLLREWGVEVGRKLPSCIGDLVQRVIFLNSPEKIEVKAGDKMFLVVVSPIPGQEYVNISGFDISNQKEFEEKFLESEKNYRMLFTNMTDAFLLAEVICNKDDKPNDYRIIKTNPAFKLHTGLKGEQILGKTMLELFPKMSPTEAKKYNEVALSGKSMKHEVFSQTLDKYLEICIFSPEKGKLALIFRDITDRKQIEKALKESEEKYRTLFETMDEGFALCELIRNHLGKAVDYRVLEVNRAFEKHAGFAPAEILGQMRTEVNSIHDERMLEACACVVETGKPTRLEMYNEGLDRWFSVGVFPCGSDQFAVLFDDTTERKRTEEALRESEYLYRTLFENTEEAFQIVKPLYDEDGKPCDFSFVKINTLYEQQTGLKAADVVGKTAKRFMPDIEPYWIEMYDKVSKKGILAHYENYNESTKRWYDMFYFPYSRGQVGVLFRDITEKKEAEESMANIETARKQEIHHRIKNNLQVISSLLDLQAEKFNGKTNIKDSEVVEAFKESQDRVISMALIHEELHKGKEIDTLNFSQYLQELADNLFLTYRFGNDCISLDMGIEEDIYFDMDTAVPLGIIINELVSNSLKYAFTGRNKGKIQIKLHREETGECKNQECSTTFTLSVSDNGVGIPENLDIQDLDSLGLQLVTTLVEQLDGELELNRKNGTEFIMKFTVTEDDNQASMPIPQLVDND